MPTPFSMNLRAKSLRVALSASTSPFSFILRGISLRSPVSGDSVTVQFGANTRRQYGGFDLGYTGTGSLTIVSGDSAAAFTIAAGKLVLAGTAGAAPPALSSDYSLLVSDGAGWSKAVRVTVVPNARHVATAAELGAHGASYGETIFLRDGTYVSQGANGGPKILTPSGTFTGSNHVVLTADNMYRSTISNFYCAGGMAIRNLQWSSQLSGNGFECVRLTGNDYIIENNIFEIDDPAISSRGIFVNGAIQNLTIQNNVFRGMGSNILAGVNGTQSNNVLIDSNVFADMGEDAAQLTNTGSVTFTNNLIIDKLTPADSQAHPDILQINTLTTTTTSGPVLGDLIVRGNIYIRGTGGDGGYAGLHGVFAGPWQSAARYANIWVENNFFQGTNLNAITLNDCGVNVSIRNNTLIYDPGAPDIIGIGAGGDSYPSIQCAASGAAVVTGNIVAGTITASGATTTNTGNIVGVRTLVDQIAVFRNPYLTGSGNSGIVDLVARKLDAVSRYQTQGTAAGLGAFAPLG